jgi:hypothetical protein
VFEVTAVELDLQTEYELTVVWLLGLVPQRHQITLLASEVNSVRQNALITVYRTIQDRLRK